jgi:DNA-binding transcriptional MerR regulator
MEKGPDAFRTISEVAAELEVPQHVLRFWESRFHEIRPMKRGGGRRFYRPQDLDLLRGIRYLLYGEGYTIRGVQRILREQGQRFVQQVWQPGAPQPTRRAADATARRDELADEAGGGLPASAEEAERHRSEDELARESQADNSDAAPGLREHRARMLAKALDELCECKRLLDAALAEGA